MWTSDFLLGAACGFVIGAFTTCTTEPAKAHDAPSGWVYDLDCCSNRDCQRIDAEAVEELKDAWRIKSTQEIMPKASVRKSHDEFFHRCTVGGNVEGRTRCLYVPEFGS